MIKSLSIIFPIFNEELRLKSSFVHILSFIKKKKFKIEIIFVDDGSKDNSYNLINQFINNFKNLGIKNKIKMRVIKSKKKLRQRISIKIGSWKSKI